MSETVGLVPRIGSRGLCCARVEWSILPWASESGLAKTPPTKGEATVDFYILKSWLQAKLAKDERGANLVEYILLIALIALLVFAAVTFLKDKIGGKFSSAGTALN
jgi:Flp pilus assembly pilin Flp